MRSSRIAAVTAAIAIATAACTATSTTTSATPTTTTNSPPLATTLAPLPTTAPTTTTTTQPPEVVTLWADEATANALEAIGTDFTTRRGIDVEVVVKPFPSILSDVFTATEAGEGPDLFVGAHSWTGSLLDAGAVGPIRGLPLVQRDEFIAPALEAFRIEGTLYGIPYAAETIALWVNTDLGGIDPPATFDQLLDVCDGLSIDVVCLAVAGGAGIPEAYYQYPFLTGFGGSIFRYEDGVGYTADRVGIDEPEAIQASEFLAALDRGDYLPPLDYVTAKQRFLEGEVAFWLTGHWEADDIGRATETRGFSTIVTPMPPIGETPARTFIDALGIFLGSSASTEAKIFLTDWLATGETMIALAPAPPLFPAHEEAASRVTDRLRLPFLDAMRQAVPTPNLSQMTNAVWDAWGSALTAIRDDGAEPEAALFEAATIIRRILGLPQPTADDAASDG